MAIQSNVVWNRELTPAEAESILAQLATAVTAGTTSGEHTGGPPDPSVRVWTTTDAANSWVAFVNTFSPPPVSATTTS
jgi:hypothetical protein